MHPSVMRFLGDAVTRLGLASETVLDVGARDVNGSPRSLFGGSYTGLDAVDGPGVDVVLDAHELNSIEGFYQRFGAIVCTEMLEHDSRPWTSLLRMAWACRPGGYLLLTCRGYDVRNGQTVVFPVHEYPDDLWRFSTGGVRSLLDYARWDAVEVGRDPDEPGVFAVARARR